MPNNSQGIIIYTGVHLILDLVDFEHLFFNKWYVLSELARLSAVKSKEYIWGRL
jgi:hypothetical protein